MQTPRGLSVEDIREIGVARENGVGSEHASREAAVFRPTRDRFARPLRKPWKGRRADGEETICEA